MTLKREFGTAVTRLLWGGTRLSRAERSLLEALVAALPPGLRQTVEAQFGAYNLVQRESDGRALNFYLKRGGKVTTDGLPLLSHKGTEAPLVRARAVAGGRPLHAVLTSVQGRAFSLTLDRQLGAQERLQPVEVEDTIQAWRSNF
jgi:hypothetical protein